MFTDKTMFISVLKITIFLPNAQNLKDKRRVLKRLKDVLRNRFNISVAEVEDMDLWQKATIGIAVVGNVSAFTDSVINSVMQFIKAENDCEVISETRETIPMGNFV
jgi:uncharacterized protein YlxP (DUF503 family)